MADDGWGDDLWADPRPGQQRAVWDEWESLLRARRDGRVSDAEYRRATASLRARLDSLGTVRPEPPARAAAAEQPPPPAVPTERPRGGELLERYGGIVTFALLVLVLSAAVGYALTRLAG